MMTAIQDIEPPLQPEGRNYTPAQKLKSFRTRGAQHKLAISLLVPLTITVFLLVESRNLMMAPTSDYFVDHVTLPKLLQNVTKFPFAGFYMCREQNEAYGAAWLASKSKFLRVVASPIQDIDNPDWSVQKNASLGKPVSMARASFRVIHKAKGAWRTVDVLEFAVEHLSGYSKWLWLDQHSKSNRMSKEIVAVMEKRVTSLATDWSLGIDADKSTLQPNVLEDPPVPLGDRVLVVIPFHSASNNSIFAGIKTNTSTTNQAYTDTRQAFFRATLYSISRIFQNIVVYVENDSDFAYCKEQPEFQFLDIIHLGGIGDNRLLPFASVLDLEHRLRIGLWSQFKWIYFTEADQILRLRPHQLGDLLVRASSRDNAVVTPHRLAAFPHPQDFSKDFVNSLKYFKRKFDAIKSKTVIDIGNVAEVRCCQDLGDCRNKDDWVPLLDTDGESHHGTSVKPWAKRPPIKLLRVGDGSYHLVNGDPQNRQFRWRTCSIETNLQCSTNTAPYARKMGIN